MQPIEIFKRLIKNITADFKSYGYSRKGNLFYKHQAGNWGLISFQKSQKSNFNELLFTINLGICSDLLTRFYSPEVSLNQPSLHNCCWKRRIGELLEGKVDKWWSITSTTSVHELTSEIHSCLFDKSLTELDHYIPDEQLKTLWISGISPGITDINRLMNLSVYFKANGQVVQLESVLRELIKETEAKASTSLVKQHIRQLGEGNHE